jgi:NADH:ubiquinone oxidoreductase subunit F (NADH-binding)
LSIRDGTVQATGIWRSPLGNVSLDAHFTEIQEGARTSWKLVSLNLGGTPALAAPGQ